MCLSPISLPVKAAGRIYRYNIVPCGKCVECVDRKQKDMLQVFLNVSRRYGDIVFATFTYSDEFLPRMFSVWDYESGSVVDQGFSKDLFHIDEFNDVFERPSLRRKDWRLWLKRARVAYERKHGHKLDFVYACIGEYGKLHQRPHYHCLFFGASLQDIEELCSSWNLGYHFCEYVNKNQSYTAVCRYMAKYLYKGLFESGEVLEGLCEKPRVIASKNLIKIDEDFKNWLIGKDLGLSLDTPYLSPDIAQRLLDRRKILIDDFNYRLGNHYINKIFKRYEINEEGKRKLVSTPLQNALSYFVRSSFDHIRDRQLAEAQSFVDRKDGFAYIEELRKNDEASLLAREESKCKTLEEYYKRSKL